MENKVNNFFDIIDYFNGKNNLFYFVSKIFPIESFLKYRKGNKYLCPFHKDSVPSAVLHNDKDGLQRLHCYSLSCQYQYTSYHYIKRILKESPLNFVMNKLGETKVKEIINSGQLNFVEEKNYELTEFVFSDVDGVEEYCKRYLEYIDKDNRKFFYIIIPKRYLSLFPEEKREEILNYLKEDYYLCLEEDLLYAGNSVGYFEAVAKVKETV